MDVYKGEAVLEMDGDHMAGAHSLGREPGSGALAALPKVAVGEPDTLRITQGAARAIVAKKAGEKTGRRRRHGAG